MWLVGCSAGSEDILESLIVVFSPGIIAPELHDLVSPRVYSGLKVLVGWGAGLGSLIWEQPYGRVPRVVVDEYNIISVTGVLTPM